MVTITDDMWRLCLKIFEHVNEVNLRLQPSYGDHTLEPAAQMANDVLYQWEQLKRIDDDRVLLPNQMPVFLITGEGQRNERID